MSYKRDITYYRKRYDALLTERSTWETPWHDAAYYSLPNAYQIMDGYTKNGNEQTEYNRRPYEDIVSTLAYEAVDIFVSGMQNAASPASRPWVKVRLTNEIEDERYDIKLLKPKWQNAIQDLISQKLAYSVAQMYANLFVFGTSCTLLEYDANNIIKAVDVPVGSYCLSEDQYGVVNTVYRSFRLKAYEAYEIFGNKLSQNLKRCVESGYVDEYFDFVHVVEPNPAYSPLPFNKNNKLQKPFVSIYFEVGGNSILQKGGYDRFPYACPRWSKSPNQAYGVSLVMRTLPAIKQLQHMCKNIILMKDQVANPVLIVDPFIQESANNLVIPLGIRCIAGARGDYANLPVVPVTTVNPSAIQIEQEERTLQEQRVNNALHVNLFQILSMQNNIKTATEVLEMKNESLSLIAPKTQSLHNEGLKKFAEETFYALLSAEKLPLPAESIVGGIEIEFDSVLTQAQKVSGLGATQKFLELTGLGMQTVQLSQGKIDGDKLIDRLVEDSGVDPGIVRSQEEVNQARQAQAEMIQQQQQMAMAEQSAKAVQNLSNSNLENLTQMMGE